VYSSDAYMYRTQDRSHTRWFCTCGSMRRVLETAAPTATTYFEMGRSRLSL